MPEITQLEKRINVKEILRDPGLRRAMLVPALQAIQHREGVMTTREQAEAYANGHSVNEISYETADILEKGEKG